MVGRIFSREAQHACVEAPYRLAEIGASHGAGADAIRLLEALETQFKDADADFRQLRRIRALRNSLAARAPR